MAENTKPAFLSYSRADADFALRLAKDLKKAGVAAWLDQLDISPGEHWDRAVEEALNDCSKLLVILSPSSVASDNVMDEVSFALREGTMVVPIIYRDCAVPLRLHRLQYADFRHEYARGFSELLRTLPYKPVLADGLGTDERQHSDNNRRPRARRPSHIQVIAPGSVAGQASVEDRRGVLNEDQGSTDNERRKARELHAQKLRLWGIVLLSMLILIVTVYWNSK